MIIVELLVFICLIDQASGAVLNWSYDSPDNWGGTCENGNTQSPIDITLDRTYYCSKFTEAPVHFENFSSINGTLSNNGYTIQFTINKKIRNDMRPRITGNILSGKEFVLEQFHFHWGSGPEENDGSEHAIEGVKTPLELHFFMYNADIYSLSEALLFKYGTAGLAFMIEIGEDNATNFTEFAGFLSQILKEDSKVSVALDLENLIPTWVYQKQSIFYRYYGSWTTPPCLENVVMILYKETIKIPKRIMDLFWQTRIERTDKGTKRLEKKPLMNTYRPLQKSPGVNVATNDPKIDALGCPALKEEIHSATVGKEIKTTASPIMESKAFNLAADILTYISCICVLLM